MEPESRDPARDGSALREMAKLANASGPKLPSPPRKPHADHSGVVDLAALMAQEPNWLEGALARAKVSAGATLAPPTFSPGSIAPTMTELEDGPNGLPRSRSLPLVIACAGAGLLVAAACVFAVRMSHPVAPVAPVQAPVQAVAVPHVEESVIPPPPPPADSVAAVAPPAQAAAATLPPAAADDTAAPDPEAAPGGHHGHHGRHGARVTAAAAAPVAPVAAKEADAPVPAPARKGAPPAPHAGSALDAALRAAAGPAAAAPAAEAAPAPATPRPPPAAEGRPERPSGSAVTSALTEVLPGARKCVAAMSDASRALVTFGSEGKVQKVDVSGPAAADAKAAGCMKAAFGRARVPAFSQSTYAAGVTVRP